MKSEMKIHIIAGSHKEAQAWIWEQWQKDPFRAALRKANGVQLWDNYKYVSSEQDLMGHPPETPLVFVGAFWKSPVYNSEILKRFNTPKPSTQQWVGIDFKAFANSAMTFGIQSGKSAMTAEAMMTAIETMKDYCVEDVKFVHDAVILTAKER